MMLMWKQLGTNNQLSQYVKCIGLTWLKCYIIYPMNEKRGELSVNEFNDIEKTSFNYF